MVIRRFSWAISAKGRIAHIVYGNNVRIEGEKTACGILTVPGWRWVAAAGLKYFRARRCKRCEAA